MRLHIFGIEVNAVMQCNLACAGCSHASPVATAWSADPRTVLRDLTAVASVADVDEVRVVGGEPLLHPSFTEVLRAIKSSGIGGTVRVITNGTRLHRVGLEWVELVDEVYVSVYPGAVISAHAVRDLRVRAGEAGTRVAVNRFTNFRPVVPVRPLTPDQVAAVFETCQVAHSWSCHTIQEGYVYLCPMTVPGPSSRQPQASRCAIEPLETLAERLDAFLNATTPLPECRSCLGTVGQPTPHRQANRRTWLPLSRSDIDWEHVERVRADPWADNGCVDNTVPLGL
ncbi:radical SAM protein [Micromonospora sp. WMMD1082]|uniref:radical SAM protein n=1 Tax=Micromonospora sp. WMMD1082 TaxID=3016104 RepID=UPI00241703E7|nr:radical SAM protein [Micromonospora sp. WMMD1082]MDG4793688.1 radical SAM protein [Micromonospora sp. WMMD1082]